MKFYVYENENDHYYLVEKENVKLRNARDWVKVREISCFNDLKVGETFQIGYRDDERNYVVLYHSISGCATFCHEDNKVVFFEYEDSFDNIVNVYIHSIYHTLKVGDKVVCDINGYMFEKEGVIKEVMLMRDVVGVDFGGGVMQHIPAKFVKLKKDDNRRDVLTVVLTADGGKGIMRFYLNKYASYLNLPKKESDYFIKVEDVTGKKHCRRMFNFAEYDAKEMMEKVCAEFKVDFTFLYDELVYPLLVESAKFAQKNSKGSVIAEAHYNFSTKDAVSFNVF